MIEERPSLLCIDDSPTVRARLEHELAPYARVRTAASWSDALPLLIGEVPDCLLLDVEIPGFSGPDIAGLVRRTFGRDRRIVLVLLSSLPSAELEAARVQAKIDVAIRKTFDRRMILALRSLLTRIAGRRQRGF